jgi:hypothetical protein
MAKEKFTLQDLKVTSFVTTLQEQELNDLKGGYIIQGRRYTYRSRWTSVDTRVEMQDSSNQSGTIKSF